VPEPERIFNTLQRSNLDNKSLTDAEYREKRNARKLFGMPANVPAELRWGMSICKSVYLTDEEVKNPQASFASQGRGWNSQTSSPEEDRLAQTTLRDQSDHCLQSQNEEVEFLVQLAQCQSR
jgi:hypothetical protein